METKKKKIELIAKEIKIDKYYSLEAFMEDAKRYIKAIKEERMICSIGSVSNSGMSRTIKFVEMAKRDKVKKYSLLNFYGFFTALGYSRAKDTDYFRINGCGMDMVFHTNYTNIHKLRRMGFITKKTCEKLAQITPRVI